MLFSSEVEVICLARVLTVFTEFYGFLIPNLAKHEKTNDHFNLVGIVKCIRSMRALQNA